MDNDSAIAKKNEKNHIVRKIFEKAFKNRIPIVITLEITAACNFRCKHCYISEKERNLFLPYERIKQIIDQIVEMKGLYLTITGGDPLLHPHFVEIYTYAFLKGLIVTVFSNGSLIDDRIITLFKKYPPRCVEITFYGSSEETYFNVTGERNYGRVKENFDLLIKNNINVLGKIFVIKENFSDIHNVSDYCKMNGTGFKLDYQIISNDIKLLEKYHISVDEMVQIDSDIVTDIDEEWSCFVKKETRNNLFHCGAGRVSCWIKADDTMQLCNFMTESKINLKRYSLMDAWKLGWELLDYMPKEKGICSTCLTQEYCNICPAKSKVLTGRYVLVQEYPAFCKIAYERSIMKTERDNNEI